LRARLVIRGIKTVNPAVISLWNVPLKPNACPPVIGLHGHGIVLVSDSKRLMWKLTYIRTTPEGWRWSWRAADRCLAFSGKDIEQRVELGSCTLCARSRVDRVAACKSANRAVRNDVRGTCDRRGRSNGEKCENTHRCTQMSTYLCKREHIEHC